MRYANADHAEIIHTLAGPHVELMLRHSFVYRWRTFSLCMRTAIPTASITGEWEAQ